MAAEGKIGLERADKECRFRVDWRNRPLAMVSLVCSIRVSTR
jgi:hypothetical protein